MATTASDLESEAIRELGAGRVALMKQNTRHRIHGLLTAPGRSVEWDKALEHIALHFRPGAKPSHTIFRKKFQSQDAVKDLIKQATHAPSRIICTKLTIDAVPSGRPGIKIVRTFNEPVGEMPELVCLVVIADFQGRLITAYPASESTA